MSLNLGLPKPAAAGTALEPKAFVEAFTAGVAHERAKWVAAGASLSLLGEQASAEAVDWSALAAELNAEAGLSVPVVGA